ncbi:MAG: transcription termination factor NusA [Chitinispirillia bacterium]|jgi:N utilization substance protein A
MATKKKKKKEISKAMDIAAALSAVTKEKSISIDLVLDSLKDAIASAAKKYLNSDIPVEVSVDRERGTIEAFTVQYVANEVEDTDTQISIKEAKKIDPELEIGDEVVGELDINEFGRAAIQTAKQIIMQRVREFERQKIFTDYSERIGELVTGTVQQIDKGNILINLGRTEAILPYKEQIRRERYRQGDTIRGCIIEVKNSIKGPQVIISRTSPIFLERLFEIEVPEIFENIVRIIKVVRAPGYRAKIGVISNDQRVDPVGACVGMRGNRVQAIVRELSNERMDIINWTEETNLIVRRIFSPSEVKRVFPVGENRIVVIVMQDDLAQAIGKDGQNIKLASKLIDKEIDIYGDEAFEELTDEQREEILSEKQSSDDTHDSLEAIESNESESNDINEDKHIREKENNNGNESFEVLSDSNTPDATEEDTEGTDLSIPDDSIDMTNIKKSLDKNTE